MDKRNFITRFSRNILDGQASLFLGAGSSIDAGYPSWKDLFAPMARELSIDINDITDYYQLAQYYANEFGDPQLKRMIKQYVYTDAGESTLLETLSDIDFNNVWTVNFDNAYESNLTRRSSRSINKVFTDSDLASIDESKRVNLFKLNGDISNADAIIAKQQDYELYNSSHNLMLMFFKRELILNTFLFIGYSFTDHLVLDCLSEINNQLGDAAPHHYTILKKEDSGYFQYFIKDLRDRYHIDAILVDDYKEIIRIIEELNQAVKSRKVFISGSFSYFDKTIENFSHALSRELTKTLFENDYRIVNGIGRRFGTHLIGYATEYLAKKSIRRPEKYMIITPFVDNSSSEHENKKVMRESVIEKCGSAVFVFGENDKNAVNRKSGVMEEFEIAKKLHKVIIPIAYPNTVSFDIWQDVKDNLTEYPYLEKNIDMLSFFEKDERNASNISKQLLGILEENNEF